MFLKEKKSYPNKKKVILIKNKVILIKINVHVLILHDFQKLMFKFKCHDFKK